MNPFKIGPFTVGPGHKPFVIAEMSGNHNQSLERALAIVDAAAATGVQGMKIQTYTADTMTLDLDRDEFFIKDPKSLWKGNSLYKLYQEAYTPWEWHKAIFDRCREKGMVGFSTPFDATSVDFLEGLGVEVYKIASFENTDLPLLRKVAAMGKPIIMSTGMASMAEIDEAVSTLRAAGAKELILLKCTSAYPAPADEMNLRTIPHLAQAFGVEAGLSDHTMGGAVAIAAVALGACVVEKHFTLSREERGPDSEFSMEPQEFREMVEGIRLAEKALGHVHYGVSAREAKSRVFRRSIFVVRDVKAGEMLTEENVRVIRPGFGLHSRHLPDVVGRVATHDLARGTPLKWEHVGGRAP